MVLEKLLSLPKTNLAAALNNMNSLAISKKGGLVLISTILLTVLFALIYLILLKHSAEAQSVDVSMFKTPATSVFTQNLKPIVYAPKFFSIEKIGLKDVPVVEVGVDAVGRLEVPKSFDEAGWYKEGAKPGESGNTIIAGHYDRVGGSPAVFFDLVKLEAGDGIQVRDASDRKFNYVVKTVEYVDVNDPSAIEKAYEHSDEPIMTVITCGGVWNSYSHDYSKRLLIKAELMK